MYIYDHLLVLTYFNVETQNRGFVQNSVTRLINYDSREIFTASVKGASWTSVMHACACGMPIVHNYDQFLTF